MSIAEEFSNAKHQASEANKTKQESALLTKWDIQCGEMGPDYVWIYERNTLKDL